jgi:hypothetical protein
MPYGALSHIRARGGYEKRMPLSPCFLIQAYVSYVQNLLCSDSSHAWLLLLHVSLHPPRIGIRVRPGKAPLPTTQPHHRQCQLHDIPDRREVQTRKSTRRSDIVREALVTYLRKHLPASDLGYCDPSRHGPVKTLARGGY